jgi:hypothetical protein
MIPTQDRIQAVEYPNGNGYVLRLANPGCPAGQNVRRRYIWGRIFTPLTGPDNDNLGFFFCRTALALLPSSLTGAQAGDFFTQTKPVWVDDLEINF